jgi:catechol 2,3-dioxygenase-like lactoylglutathione lyase family enzyme
MYDHIGLKVNDLAASQQFYQTLLAPLGHVLGYHDASQAGFGPTDAAAFWLYAAPSVKTSGTHIAFRAASHAQVDAFYKAGLKAVITARQAQDQITARPTTRRFYSTLTATTWKPFAHKVVEATFVQTLWSGYEFLRWKSTVIETMHDQIQNQSA